MLLPGDGVGSGMGPVLGGFLLSSSASLGQGRGSLSLRSLELQWHQPSQFEVWNQRGMGGGNGDESGEAKQIRTTQTLKASLECL